MSWEFTLLVSLFLTEPILLTVNFYNHILHTKSYSVLGSVRVPSISMYFPEAHDEVFLDESPLFQMQ